VRHQATKDEILDAAWALVREHGLAGLTLRDLGARVSMKPQSLYSYFSSKNDIYDAMFRQGYEALIAQTTMQIPDEPPRDVLPLVQQRALLFFDFCTSDPVRYQLLFQRTIPDFEPSADSFALAIQAYDQTIGELARLRVTDSSAMDLWTAVMTGLADQQISNDPGGHRWRDLVPRAMAMLLTELDTTADPPAG
jgi:AcrR family transcriptional regulator